MTCGNCGHMMAPKDIPEATDSGRFTEHWQCPNCGANEYISGKEEEPMHKWEHWGSAV